MSHNAFYMTLLSNSSMTYYPENRTTSFTVQLPRYMYLDGDWEVALTEIQYPYTFLNVENDENEIQLETYDITEELLHWHINDSPDKGPAPLNDPILINCNIIPGYYTDIKDILTAINEEINKKTKQPTFFEFYAPANKVGAGNEIIEIGRKWIESCKLSTRLALQLGYQPNTKILGGLYAPHVVNISTIIPEKMLIYCDILEPQIIGDSWGKVLRVVSTNAGIAKPYFGQSCSTMFNPPQYIPVQAQNFEGIKIDIRDIEGRLMPFQYGTLSVKLHFKKINYTSKNG